MPNGWKALSLLSLMISTTICDAQARQLTVRLTVPDSGWTLAISEVHQVKDELWVISTVSRRADAVGVQVISTLEDTVQIEGPDLPVKHIVIGKTWAWENEEPVWFLKDFEQVKAAIYAETLVYRRHPQ